MAQARSCPTCGKPVASRAANRAFPFCSDRCRLLDLGKWLAEDYRIPAGRPGDGAVAAPTGNPEDES
jgi:endogenous inhibitor of DNA gyrase (YacG/DUF329 family)